MFQVWFEVTRTSYQFLTISEENDQFDTIFCTPPKFELIFHYPQLISNFIIATRTNWKALENDSLISSNSMNNSHIASRPSWTSWKKNVIRTLFFPLFRVNSRAPIYPRISLKTLTKKTKERRYNEFTLRTRNEGWCWPRSWAKVEIKWNHCPLKNSFEDRTEAESFREIFIPFDSYRIRVNGWHAVIEINRMILMLNNSTFNIYLLNNIEDLCSYVWSSSSINFIYLCTFVYIRN